MTNESVYRNIASMQFRVMPQTEQWVIANLRTHHHSSIRMREASWYLECNSHEDAETAIIRRNVRARCVLGSGLLTRCVNDIWSRRLSVVSCNCLRCVSYHIGNFEAIMRTVNTVETGKVGA